MSDVVGAEVRESAGWLVEMVQRWGAIERPGWVYASPWALLAAHGRLFAPAPWPGGSPTGQPGRCFLDSLELASGSSGDLVYVEGWAGDTLFEVAHAWCATRGGVVRDATWRTPGAAYLGLPLEAATARGLLGDAPGWVLHGPDGMVSPVALEWMRTGVPPGTLADVGAPLTTAMAAEPGGQHS